MRPGPGRPEATALAAALALVLMVVLAGCAGAPGRGASGPTPSTSPTTPPLAPVSATAPATFVSERSQPDQSHSALAVSSAAGGRLLRRLHALPWNGMDLSSTAVDAAGHVWVTLNKGPACTSDVAGCGPKPHSCASQVLELGPGPSAIRTVLRGSDDELISQAQPSPDGRRLAYVHSGCARSYLVSDLRVRDLASGRTLVIGSALAPCHLLATPRWTLDGTHLAVVYGAAQPVSGLDDRPSSQLGFGQCNEWNPAGVTVVDAGHGQPGLVGATTAPVPGCEVAAATPTRTGLALVEQCGWPTTAASADHRVLLVQVGPGPTGTSTIQIGTCGDGAQISADPGGSHLLVSSYQYCTPGSVPPTTWVLATSAGATTPPRAVTHVVSGGGPFDGLSW